MTTAHPSGSTVEFVYFDLGNVLVAFDHALAGRNLAAAHQVSPPAVVEAVYDSGLQELLEHGQLSIDEFVTRVVDSLGLSDDGVCRDGVLEALSAIFTPIDAMDGVIELVRSRGCRVGLLSNTCLSHWEWIARQDFAVLRPGFDVLVLSYEVGAMKPHPSIYRRAEQLARCPAERILFLDDKPENVDAARRRGWRAETCLGGPQAWSLLKRHLARG